LATPESAFAESSLFMSELFGDMSFPNEGSAIDLLYGTEKQHPYFYYPFEAQRMTQIMS